MKALMMVEGHRKKRGRSMELLDNRNRLLPAHVRFCEHQGCQAGMLTGCLHVRASLWPS